MERDGMEKEHQNEEIAKESEPDDPVVHDSSKNLLKIEKKVSS
jgi:hypothetical protein